MKVSAPGVRAATFKLLERAPDSYFLYRSSRKIGTARVEDDGSWTAWFEGDDPEGERQAKAGSGKALIRVVGGSFCTKHASSRRNRSQRVRTVPERGA